MKQLVSNAFNTRLSMVSHRICFCSTAGLLVLAEATFDGLRVLETGDLHVTTFSSPVWFDHWVCLGARDDFLYFCQTGSG